MGRGGGGHDSKRVRSRGGGIWIGQVRGSGGGKGEGEGDWMGLPDSRKSLTGRVNVVKQEPMPKLVATRKVRMQWS